MIVPKILIFAGSTRKDSFNKKLALTCAHAARSIGCEVTYLDLKDYPLPFYDGDVEGLSGIPENARVLKTIIANHHGFIIASPEYNNSISGVLKNTIDWMSVSLPDENFPVRFSSKAAVLMSASTGNLGGFRGLSSLRSILENLKILVLPQQLVVSMAHEAFGEDGRLKDPKPRSSLEEIIAHFSTMLRKLNS